MKYAKQVGKKKQEINQIITHEPKDAVRLNKYISNSGYCSRREADKLIEQGLVYIDGELAVMGSKVQDGQKVTVDGKLINKQENFVYMVLNKPKGVTCTSDLKDKSNIVTFMNYGSPIFPIGRLDKDTTGLILLTNDGDIVNKILRSSNEHEKEYIVRVNHRITNDFIENMRNGVTIYNAVTNAYQETKPAIVNQIDDYTFSLIITEGMNRQIRRMCTALNYHVDKLKRIRVMNIKVDYLDQGCWRYLDEKELEVLNSMLHD